MTSRFHQPSRPLSRRSLLKQSAVFAGFTVVPRFVLGGTDQPAPSEKLNIAVIGVGGKGYSDAENVSSQNIVALCDVDDNRAKDTFNKYPEAKRYKDFRKMFDEMANDIDAVLIATPDHHHLAPTFASASRPYGPNGPLGVPEAG